MRARLSRPLLSLVVMLAALGGACDEANDKRAAVVANPAAPPMLTVVSEPATPGPSARTPSAPALPAATAVPYALDSMPSQPPPLARWTPSDLPLFSGPEAANPRVIEYFGDPVWRVYRVQGADVPELLYNTPRYIHGIRWTSDGGSATAVFTTIPSIPPAPNDDPSAGYPTGILRFGFAPGLSVTDLVLNRGAHVYPSPSGDRFAIVYRRMHCDPNVQDACRVASPALAHTSEILILTGSGTASRLDGLGDYTLFRGWAPDSGSVFVAPLRAPPGLPRATYRVSLSGGVPIVAGPETGPEAIDAFSADGRFLLRRHHQPGDNRVEIVERASGQVRPLSDSTPPNYAYATWIPGEATVLLQVRGVVSLVDAVSGAAQPIFRSTEHHLGHSFVSPDGWQIAITEQLSSIGEHSPLCPGLVGPYRLWLYDRRTADLRVVRNCGDSYATWLDWLPGGRHVVIADPPPRQSEDDRRAVALIDLLTGRTQPLTNGLEHKGRATISPDGARILVTGHALRIYSADGRLLRTIPVPDQSDVVSAAWSPDGRSIIYVLGPRGFFTL